MFHSYRSGKQPISNKAWAKLEAAERAAGIGVGAEGNAESSANPKEPAGGGEKDLRMERLLRLARELNASLAPAIEAEITRTLSDLIHPLETVAKNDGEFSRRMLEAAKSRLDDFAAWSAAQRQTRRKPEGE